MDKNMVKQLYHKLYKVAFELACIMGHDYRTAYTEGVCGRFVCAGDNPLGDEFQLGPISGHMYYELEVVISVFGKTIFKAARPQE